MFDHWYTDYIDDENKPVREAAKAAWDFQQYKLEELSKQRDELLEALKRAEPLAKLASLVTVKQAIYAGDWAINACGLDPYCLNDGSALGNELAVAWWKIKEVSEAISSAEK